MLRNNPDDRYLAVDPPPPPALGVRRGKFLRPGLDTGINDRLSWRGSVVLVAAGYPTETPGRRGIVTIGVAWAQRPPCPVSMHERLILDSCDREKRSCGAPIWRPSRFRISNASAIIPSCAFDGRAMFESSEYGDWGRNMDWVTDVGGSHSAP